MEDKIVHVDNIDKDVCLDSKVVVTYGHFTTIHPGHLRYLKNAKNQGDQLIVVLEGDIIDGKQKKYSQIERAKMLECLDIVFKIIFLNTNEFKKAISLIRPDVLVLGKEHEKTKERHLIDAIEFHKACGKEVIFDAGETNYASTDYLSNNINELAVKRRILFTEKCRKLNITKDGLMNFFRTVSNSHVLVIGDSIVDKYIACEALGLSAEAPVVVVKELEEKSFSGGAAVVAQHIKALGVKCTYISVIGDDDEGRFIEAHLRKSQIKYKLFEEKGRPTTLKKRYTVGNQKLFRVSRLEDKVLLPETENKIMQAIENKAEELNTIVISDFNYGVISQKIIKKIVEVKEKYDIKVIGDVQSSSQVGNILKLECIDVICPNEREARIALQDNQSGIEALSNEVIEKTGVNSLIMKLGGDGLICYEKSNDEIFKESFPAISANPVDEAGAGDSLLAVLSAGIGSGLDVFSSAALGSCMASLAVEAMGNSPISKDALQERIISLFNDD